jgi:hypothetical protein
MFLQPSNGKMLFSNYNPYNMDASNKRSEQVLTICYVCRQLRDETRYLPFQHCLLVAHATLLVRFLAKLDAVALAGHITSVVVLSPNLFQQQELTAQLSGLGRLKHVLLRWGRIHCTQDDAFTAAAKEVLRRARSGKSVQVEVEYALNQRS